MNRFTLIALSLLACALPTGAMAYGHLEYCGKPIKWSAGTAHLRHAANSFPAGSRLRQRSGETIQRFNENPADVRFTAGYDDGNVWFGNGQSEVWFTTAPQGAPARTRYRFRLTCNPRMKEADIIFQLDPDQTSQYSSSDATWELWPYGGDWRPYATTLMHELGHAAGLDHEHRFYNIMGQDWDHIHADDGRARAYLGEDASNGLVAMYGHTDDFFEDLSVSQFEYDGNPGGDAYSHHRRTDLRAGDGGALPWFFDGGERVYEVRRGQTVRARFTYENNGKSTHSAAVGFYLSQNDDISTHDRRIGGWQVTLVRNVPATATRAVTIPADAPLGFAWLGVYIDDGNTVAEAIGSNNATHQRIRIRD